MARLDRNFWNDRYQADNTPWDLGEVSPAIKRFIDHSNLALSTKILIPGAGNAYEAEYLFNLGYTNTFVIDLSGIALDNLKKRVPAFPSDQLLNQDFFKLKGKFDLIIEQTFFCALDPSLRADYVKKMSDLLVDEGRLIGLLFNTQFEGGPPFGGNILEYRQLFRDTFVLGTIETSTYSIKPRLGKELWIDFYRKIDV